MSEKHEDGVPAIQEKLEMYDDEKQDQEHDHQQAAAQENEAGHGGDTGLANAPWKFKLIALATALMLPVGSHFSASAISAMKATVKEVSISKRT
jgi:hypothetical protein